MPKFTYLLRSRKIDLGKLPKRGNWSQRTANNLQRALLVILALTGLSAALWRFVDLERDPPQVSWSIGEWTDPGHYLYNARSRVLFGDWRTEEGTSLFVTPGYTILAACWFFLFGTGYSRAVLLSVLAGFLIIGATALCAEAVTAASDNKRLKFWAGSAAAVSLLLSYIVFSLQRVPKGDMESIAVSTLTALAFMKIQPPGADLERKAQLRFFSILAGLGMGLAPFIKLYSGLFSLACVLGWIAGYFSLDDDWKKVWRRATPFLGLGLLIAGLIWLTYILWLARLNLLNSLSSRPLSVARVVVPSIAPTEMSQTVTVRRGAFSPGRFLQSNLFYHQPVETLLATVALFRWILNRRRNWPLLLASIWLIVGCAALAFMDYAPLRYRALFIPPIIILAVHQWTELAAGNVGDCDRWKNILICIATAVVLGYVLSHSFLGIFPTLRSNYGDSRLLLSFVCITPAISLLLWAGFRCFSPQMMAFGLALALFSAALPQWCIRERDVSHELRDTAHWIVKEHPNAVLGGLWGAELALWTDLNAYLTWTENANKRVTLFVDEPGALDGIPLLIRSSGLTVRVLKPIHRSIYVMEIKR